MRRPISHYGAKTPARALFHALDHHQITCGGSFREGHGLLIAGAVIAGAGVFEAGEDSDDIARAFFPFHLTIASGPGEELPAMGGDRLCSDGGVFAVGLSVFHIDMADGFYHPNENAFLEEVSKIFGQTDAQFKALRARFVPDAPKDPYTVLGVPQDMPLPDIRKIWRQLVRETHPDAMMARGVPEEAIRLAEKKMIDINRAWDEINGARA